MKHFAIKTTIFAVGIMAFVVALVNINKINKNNYKGTEEPGYETDFNYEKIDKIGSLTINTNIMTEDIVINQIKEPWENESTGTDREDDDVTEYETMGDEKEETTTVLQVTGESESIETTTSEVETTEVQTVEPETTEAETTKSVKEKETEKSTEKTTKKSSSSYIYDSDYDPEFTSDVSGEELVQYALQFLGNPYKWGGNSLTEGCDCSGFVNLIYKHFGFDVPRYSQDFKTIGEPVALKNIKPGDIVVYPGHVAIYMGDGHIVEALNKKKGITCHRLVTDGKITAIRRIL